MTESTRQPVALIRPIALVMLVVMLAVALYVLFPLRHEIVSQTPAGDSVAIGYLENLLRSDPNNRELLLGLAREYQAMGRLAEALRLLERMEDDDSEIVWLKFRLATQLYNSMQPGTLDRFSGHLLSRRYAQALPLDELTREQLETLAGYWLALEEPGRAAAIYERLARETPGQGYDSWRQAARWWLAAADSGRAIEALKQAYLQAPDGPAAVQIGHQALVIQRQLDESAALSLARELLNRHPDSLVLLDTAIDIARGQNAVPEMLQWSARYAELQPDSRQALERRIEIELAVDQPGRAVKSLRRLRDAYPQDAAVRLQLARVEEWIGNHARALAEWRFLAQNRVAPRHDGEVIRLARMLNEDAIVLEALERGYRHYGLDTEQRWSMILLLEHQGQPERAIAYLQAWSADGNMPDRFWQRLARLQEARGDLVAALNTWERYARQHGRDVTETLARARLHVRLWQPRQALAIMASLTDPPPAEATDYWSFYGHLAWQADDMVAVREAYWRLHQSGQLDVSGYQRLIQAAFATGAGEQAMAATQAGWEQHGDADIIVTALLAAQQAQQPAYVAELFRLAAEQPAALAASGDYWQLYGEYLHSRGQLTKAYQAYRRALALRPYDSALRAAMIYLLAESNRHDELARVLDSWADDARYSAVLWPAYATGYTALKRPRRALRWYQWAVKAEPGNVLLLLDYADTLELLERADSALRMRQYAVSRIRQQLWQESGPQASADAASLTVMRRLVPAESLYPPATRRALLLHLLAAGAGSEERAVTSRKYDDAGLLLTWYLGQQMPAYARYWYQRAQLQRLQTERWQQLSLALQANDETAIQNILLADAGQSTLDVNDQVTALRRLDFNEQAQRLALDHVGVELLAPAGRQTLARQAAELYRERPQNTGVQLEAGALGDLDIFNERTWLTHSAERWRFTVEGGAIQFADDGLNADLGGLDQVQYAGVQLSWLQRRGHSDFNLRYRHSDDADTVRVGILQGWQFTRRLEGEIFASLNEDATESGELRVLGNRHRLGAGLEWSPTARDTLSLDAAYNSYITREREKDLGDGYQLEAAASHALLAGPTYQLTARLLARTLQNSPVNNLPPDVSRRLPAGSEGDDVVPDDFTFVGVGVSFSRGLPGSDYPLVASPRYQLDLEAGLGVNASASIGTSVIGSDELSLQATYSQSDTTSASSSYNIMLKYQFFFGQ